MGIKFKCNQSGNIFEFFSDHDIKTMRAHPEYIEIKEEQQKEVEVVEPVKRMGRPPKTFKEE